MRLHRTCSGLPTRRRRQISPWLILCARIKVSSLRDRILDGGLGQADPPFICGTQDKTRLGAGRDRDGLWATFLAPLPSGWRRDWPAEPLHLQISESSSFAILLTGFRGCAVGPVDSQGSITVQVDVR